MTIELVLGTRNPKKRRELEQLLVAEPVIVKSLEAFPDALEIEETGATFAENATLKATVQARHLNRWVMGEDSGLSVAALGGAPGVHSARFSGPDATDASNNALLVDKLRDVPASKRDAWYTCHMTLSDPQGEVLIDVEDYCRGRMLLEPRGEAGFGYDPYFELIEYRQTFAELGDTIKSVLSHRARAMRQFLRALKPLLKDA